MDISVLLSDQIFFHILGHPSTSSLSPAQDGQVGLCQASRVRVQYDRRGKHVCVICFSFVQSTTNNK